jgi:hypothetical protein
MPVVCSLCGAQLGSDAQCQERFNQCLALEFTHPISFGAVHHLTVPCYLLQHNQYSHQAWLEARKLLQLTLEQQFSPQQLRQYLQHKLIGTRENIRHDHGFAGFNQIVWSRTIADIRLDSEQRYCDDILAWAKSILTDSASVIQAP